MQRNLLKTKKHQVLSLIVLKTFLKKCKKEKRLLKKQQKNKKKRKILIDNDNEQYILELILLNQIQLIMIRQL